MCAPERNGLFTLCEADEIEIETESETEPAFTFNLPSATESSILLPSPVPSSREMDLPRDVDVEDDGEELLMDFHRLSWSSRESNGIETAIGTPNLEEEDPFSFEYTWRDMPVDAATGPGLDIYDNDEAFVDAKDTQSVARNRLLRPPPLDFSQYHHPFSAASLSRTETTDTPRASAFQESPSLLPALPIASPKPFRTTRRPDSPQLPHIARYSRRHTESENVDLISALEDLLSSCGEPDSPSDHSSSGSEDDLDLDVPNASWFPLPPARYPDVQFPVTPSPNPRVLFPPSPPHQLKRVDARQPCLQRDHTFLEALSRGERHSPATSAGSGGSKRSLPERKGLPGAWMMFEQEV